MRTPSSSIILFLLAIPLTSLLRGTEETTFSQRPPQDVIDSSESAVLRFGGDCLLAAHYEEAVGDSVTYAFAGFDLLRTADIAMVNLECPITTRGQKTPKPFNFRMHPRFLSALTFAGIDVVNLANNHIYDFGKVGLFDTILYLDSVGVEHVGAGKNAYGAHAPVIKTVRGRSIAFLGYYGGSEAPKASRNKPGVANRRIDQIHSDIRKLKELQRDVYVVVNLHGGTEKATMPDDVQRQFAHDVIDAGADLIVGHHPHVLQGIERYKSGTIAYSLGNFVFGGNSRDTYDTALLEVRLQSDQVVCRLIPVRVEHWQARELTGEDGQEVIRQVQALSAGFPASVFPDERLDEQRN